MVCVQRFLFLKIGIVRGSDGGACINYSFNCKMCFPQGSFASCNNFLFLFSFICTPTDMKKKCSHRKEQMMTKWRLHTTMRQLHHFNIVSFLSFQNRRDTRFPPFVRLCVYCCIFHSPGLHQGALSHEAKHAKE